MLGQPFGRVRRLEIHGWRAFGSTCLIAGVAAYACNEPPRANDSNAPVTGESGGAPSQGTGGTPDSSAEGGATELGGATSATRKNSSSGNFGGTSATAAGGATAKGGSGSASKSSRSGAGGGTSSSAAPSTGAAGNGSNACGEYVMPSDCSIPEGAVLPGELRCTGLYEDWQTRQLRCGVREYTPAHELWSDGAGKQRYVWLPPGASIDVSKPDNWVYPVGTRFWKEFYVGPEGDQRLGETRYLLKVKGGWLYTAYVWSQDGASAVQNNDGVEDLFGSGHSVPKRDQCKTCHSGRPDYVLGWDFVMLGSGATGVTARDLAQQSALQHLDPAWLELTIPGDEVERAALSYMHANCGVSCHNQTPNATGNPSGLFLRLELAEMESVLSTDAARSGINRLPSPNAHYGELSSSEGDFYDFRPLDPERSLSLARMEFRGSVTAMPPIASHRIHGEGVAVVRAWVESMTEARGYPAPGP